MLLTQYPQERKPAIKVSPGAVVNAIPNSQVEATVDQVILSLRAALFKIVSAFVISPSAKTVLTLEQSLSGKLWKRAGAQVAITLRCILLSDIWDDVFGKMLTEIEPVSHLNQNQESVFTEALCA